MTEPRAFALPTTGNRAEMRAMPSEEARLPKLVFPGEKALARDRGLQRTS